MDIVSSSQSTRWMFFRSVLMTVRNCLAPIWLLKSSKVNGSPHHQDQILMLPQLQRWSRRRSFLWLLLYLFLLWYVLFFFVSLSWLSTFRLSIHWKSGEMAGKQIKNLFSRRWWTKVCFSVPYYAFIDIFSSYGHHLGNWNKLAWNAPWWAKFWQNELFKQILYDPFFKSNS